MVLMLDHSWWHSSFRQSTLFTSLQRIKGRVCFRLTQTSTFRGKGCYTNMSIFTDESTMSIFTDESTMSIFTPNQNSDSKKLTFTLTQQQRKKVQEWTESLPWTVPGKYKGSVTYSFTPCMEGGNVIKVKHSSGVELDITDYDSW